MREFTVASTTDTQEEVNRVAGVEPEPKPEPSAVEEPKTEPVVEKPEVKPANGYEKRINKLTAKNYALETTNQTLEQQNQTLLDRLAAIEAKVNATPPTTAAAVPAEDKEPVPEDFQKYEEYVRAMGTFTATQVAKNIAAKNAEETQKQQVAQTEQTEQERQREVFDGYMQRVSEARGRVEDFDEVISSSKAEIPEAAKLAIFEQDNGPDILYHLAKNPDECEKLMALVNRPVAAVAYIGQLAAKLQPAATVITKKPTTAAPTPITPVAGSGTKSEIPIDELPFQEYRKARENRR